MANILVFPNLYHGSALTDVSLGLVRDIKKNNFDVKIIGFDLPMTTLESGKLDNPEIFFKHNQIILEKMKNLIEDGDKILFVDMFQLGLGLLKYYLNGTKKNVKIGSLLHGASFIEGDFYKNDKWIKNFELGMVDIMDVIYMPSKYYAAYFKKDIRNKKIKILPFGFYPKDYPKSLDLKDKEYDVIFPHRWSWDKRPEYFYKLAKKCQILNLHYVAI